MKAEDRRYQKRQRFDAARVVLAREFGETEVSLHLVPALKTFVEGMTDPERIRIVITDYINEYKEMMSVIETPDEEDKAQARVMSRLSVFGDYLGDPIPESEETDLETSDDLTDWFPRDGEIKMTEMGNGKQIKISVTMNRHVSEQDVTLNFEWWADIPSDKKGFDVVKQFLEVTAPSQWEVRRKQLESADVEWKLRQAGHNNTSNVLPFTPPPDYDPADDEPAKPKAADGFPKDAEMTRIVAIAVGGKTTAKGDEKPTYELYREDAKDGMKQFATDFGYPSTEGDWEGANRRIKKLLEAVPALAGLPKGTRIPIEKPLHAHYSKKPKKDGQGSFNQISDYTVEAK